MSFSQLKLTQFFSQTPENKVADRKNSAPVEKEKKLAPFEKRVTRGFLKTQIIDQKKTWGYYWLVASENFKEYKVINRMDREIIIQTTQGETKKLISIGKKVATATVDDDSILTHIEVEPLFRRQKIGYQLIIFINHCCPQFMVFGGQENNSRYRLTEEGGHLINYCLKKRKLTEEQVISAPVPLSPSNE